DRENGRTIIESAAIMIYLAEKYGRFLGQSETDRMEVLQWLIWQAASLGPLLGQAHHFLHYFPQASAYASEGYRNEADRRYANLGQRLEGREFVAGAYSIAAMAIWPWVSRFEWQQVDLASFANVHRWYEMLAG